MAKLILFSNPTESIWQMLREEVSFHKGSKLAYMPSDVANEKIKYRKAWMDWIERGNGEFDVVNNSLRGNSFLNESEKIISSDVLVITGGNTFVLLDNLRKSGLDKIIYKFSQMKGKIILGFSAGAIIMSPTIRMANCGNIDNNEVGMTDFTGLNIVPFDIFPHYEEKYEEVILDYEKISGQAVQRLTYNDFLIFSNED